jgi:hypothetical protein
VLDRRREEGKVRHCHGDLQLRNICLLAGNPTLFDCLEFSDALACIDVLYDLGFLLMDLEHRRLADFANGVLNRYLDLTGEDDGLAAMPLFLSLRAAIRAHVTATEIQRAAQPEAKPAMAAEARRYLELGSSIAASAAPAASSRWAGSAAVASRLSRLPSPRDSARGSCAVT